MPLGIFVIGKCNNSKLQFMQIIKDYSSLSTGLLCGSKIFSLMKSNFTYKCQIKNFILNSKIEFLKFRIFFPSCSKKKLQLWLISKVYPLKKNILNYNKCKLLTFKYRRASKHACAHIYIYG